MQVIYYMDIKLLSSRTVVFIPIRDCYSGQPVLSIYCDSNLPKKLSVAYYQLNSVDLFSSVPFLQRSGRDEASCGPQRRSERRCEAETGTEAGLGRKPHQQRERDGLHERPLLAILILREQENIQERRW